MIEHDRIISAGPQVDEKHSIARCGRRSSPIKLANLPSRTQMELHPSSSQARRGTDHVLIFGPPGLGKTDAREHHRE